MKTISVILVSLSVLSTVGAQAPDSADRQAHLRQKEAELRRAYPALDLAIVSSPESPLREFEAALGRARNQGVPETIIQEFAAVRFIRESDVEALRRLLPLLRADLATFTPARSMYWDRAQKEELVTNLEQILRRETAKPGSLREASLRAKEVGKARQILNDLRHLDASLDVIALEGSLAKGAPIPEEVWRKAAKPGSSLAEKGADSQGNAFGPQRADTTPRIPAATYEMFKGHM